MRLEINYIPTDKTWLTDTFTKEEFDDIAPCLQKLSKTEYLKVIIDKEVVIFPTGILNNCVITLVEEK